MYIRTWQVKQLANIPHFFSCFKLVYELAGLVEVEMLVEMFESDVTPVNIL
jgi:hypothetical protein